MFLLRKFLIFRSVEFPDRRIVVTEIFIELPFPDFPVIAVLKEGETLGDWTIREKLGQGSYGAVYTVSIAC